MRLRVLLALTVVLLSPLARPATAEGSPTTIVDACTPTTDPAKDLQSVSLAYNADGLQVGTRQCGPLYGPNGDWLITFHLTSFTPEVQITAVQQDVGRYETWSGWYLCSAASCPLVRDGDSSILLKPSGTRLDGPDHSADIETYPPTRPTTFGYGGWPSGLQIPNSTQWYAEVRTVAATDSTQIDRAPDVGTVAATRLPPGSPSEVTVSPGPAPTWQPSGALRTDSGTLRSGGVAVPDHQLSVPGGTPYLREPSDSAGAWTTRSFRQANETLRASVAPDGIHAAGVSAPYRAYVKAFVSLDLRDRATLPIGRPVDLRGVVRPRGVRGVEILVKPDAPGYAWSLLRTAPLVAGRTDTYYRVAWTPRTRGRYVLFTRWRHGTTDDGGVLNGQSTYRRITVG